MWVAAVGRSELFTKTQEMVRRSYKVCDIHFSDEQRIPGAEKKRLKSNLKADSVPCIGNSFISNAIIVLQ